MTSEPTPDENFRTNDDDPTYVDGMDHAPAYRHCPTASEIADWFFAEKRNEQNEGGDAWWLSDNPHSACRMEAFVDADTQEFWLLDITTENDGRYVSDLLWVTDGFDGRGVAWWQHPIAHAEVDAYDSRYWHRDGLVWMADQIVVHYEAIELRADVVALEGNPDA